LTSVNDVRLCGGLSGWDGRNFILCESLICDIL